MLLIPDLVFLFFIDFAASTVTSTKEANALLERAVEVRLLLLFSSKKCDMSASGPLIADRTIEFVVSLLLVEHGALCTDLGIWI